MNIKKRSGLIATKIGNSSFFEKLNKKIDVIIINKIKKLTVLVLSKITFKVSL